MASHRPGPSASYIHLTSRELRILQKLISARSTDQGLAQRAEIIILAFRKWSNSRIAKKCQLSRNTVCLWRDRYADALLKIRELVMRENNERELRNLIEVILTDAPRPGKPVRITAEQKIQLIALACEPLPQPGLPISQWDMPTLAAEAIKRKIVTEISPSYLSRLLAKANLHPHKMKY